MRKTLGLGTLVFALLCAVSVMALTPQTTAPDFLAADLLIASSPAPASCNALPASSQPAHLGFEEALFGSCNSNQCYLACIQKGYWAGYCISGTCVCQSNPSV